MCNFNWSPGKDDNERFLYNLYLINNMEDIVVFLDIKVLISDSSSKCFPAVAMASHWCESDISLTVPLST